MQTNKGIFATRSEIGAKRKYTVDAEAERLYAELESTTRIESFLRDTDYAAEMTEFARTKLVSQVGSQMLSTAMDSGRAVVDLLA